MDMEQADLLHNLWLGCARDSIGSTLLDIITFDPRFSAAGTYDNALGVVVTMVEEWCQRHKLDKSVVDELSILVAVPCFVILFSFKYENVRCLRDTRVRVRLHQV